MEILYAVTLARGIRGFNVFMLVGGENPAGFENGTGREYDLDAPIGRSGEVRPHAAVLRASCESSGRSSRSFLPPSRCATHAGLVHAVRERGIGRWSREFADAGAAMTGIFSSGDFGLSSAQSLSALLTLANVSWGRWTGAQ